MDIVERREHFKRNAPDIVLVRNDSAQRAASRTTRPPAEFHHYRQVTVSILKDFMNLDNVGMVKPLEHFICDTSAYACDCYAPGNAQQLVRIPCPSAYAAPPNRTCHTRAQDSSALHLIHIVYVHVD